jgi:hypothetical protein
MIIIPITDLGFFHISLNQPFSLFLLHPSAGAKCGFHITMVTHRNIMLKFESRAYWTGGHRLAKGLGQGDIGPLPGAVI